MRLPESPQLPLVPPVSVETLKVFVPDHAVHGGDKQLERGNTFAAKGNWRAAIGAYTKGILLDPDYGANYVARGDAYEHDGRRQDAISDYRKAVQLYDTKSIFVKKITDAKDRLAVLTGGQAPSLSTYANPRASAPNVTPPVDLQPVPVPPTSILDFGQRRRAIAPLTIETEAGTNYLLKFINSANPRDQKMIFVRGGERYDTKMPLGSYYVRAASGSTWYGKKDFFGPSTSFFRLQTLDGRQQALEFSQQGNILRGQTIVMKSVAQGNLRQEPISRELFEGD